MLMFDWKQSKEEKPSNVPNQVETHHKVPCILNN